MNQSAFPPSSLNDRLLARVIGFVDRLRDNGFTVGLGESADALVLAKAVGIMEREALRCGWRSLLCSRTDEWRRFDALFDSYWLPPNRQKMVETKAGGGGCLAMDEENDEAGGEAGPSLQVFDGEDESASAGDAALPEGSSASYTIEEADFRSLIDREQTREIEAVIRQFVRHLKQLKLRRDTSALTGARLDIRKTLRSSIGNGSPNQLRFHTPRRIRPRLVMLIDVSRSMSLYGFFHLRVARALSLELKDVHIFLYHTHLTAVSAALTDPDPWRAQERLQLLSSGWAGGTRIGECLAQFNTLHAPRMLHSRTAVMVVSDGYDSGEPGMVDRELGMIARRCRMVVWLNPLKAQPGYMPICRGMREALPHISVFAAGHNLVSLQDALQKTVEAL